MGLNREVWSTVALALRFAGLRGLGFLFWQVFFRSGGWLVEDQRDFFFPTILIGEEFA